MCTYNCQIEALKPSRSMVVMAKAKALKSADPDMIDLAGGEPDFATPMRICEEMFRQVASGYTHYTVGPGLPELRERIARKLWEENGCRYSPDSIIVTPGGKYAIYLAVRTLLNAGDEAIYLNPAWVSYPSIIEAAGGIPVAVDLSCTEQYRITESALEQVCTDRTKLLIINYPNNPTGRLLTAQDIAALKTFLQRHPQIFVLADEIYERIVFDGEASVSLASDAALLPRVITVNGFSKSVAMTGWRLGYLAADTEIAKRANKLFQHTISCVSGFVQKAGLVALDCQEEMEEMRREYEARRDLFITGLNEIEGVSCDLPKGAFYAWVRFDLPEMDSEQVCEFLLEKAKVIGVPGISYGESAAAYMRFSFATDRASLQQALKNIRIAVEAFRTKR